MNVLSLFAGIGGLELGLERAGMTVVGQVEIDPFCRQVLAKHWPDVPRHDDVRTCVEWWRSAPRSAVHVVCGGFPCQPFSTAGRRQGVGDERWGWPWFAAVVRALRPDYLLVENVAALLADRDAFGIILADLAALGYDAEWDCVPAAAVGAPHLRDRLFLVAYTQRELLRHESVAEPRCGRAALARNDGQDRPVADADGERLEGCRLPEARRRRSGPDAGRGSPRIFGRGLRPGGQWPAEPEVGRVAHGLPAPVVRAQLRGLGNAVVPQVSEYVGRLVMAAASEVTG